MPATHTPTRPLAAMLRDRKLRVTSQRLVLHQVLRELDRHASADELLHAAEDRLPAMSLPTVYATMELLEELGLARRVVTGTGAVLFDPRTDDHHHLACRRCGAVEDLHAPVALRGALDAARSHGFDAERADVVVTGLCSACREQAGDAGAPAA